MEGAQVHNELCNTGQVQGPRRRLTTFKEEMYDTGHDRHSSLSAAIKTLLNNTVSGEHQWQAFNQTDITLKNWHSLQVSYCKSSNKYCRNIKSAKREK